MPNWCWNELTVSGTPTEIKRFVDATIGLPAIYRVSAHACGGAANRI